MTLYTKCILAPKSNDDGLRISVMSRHTLQDGKTPDPRITKESFDEHRPDLAPSPGLVGAFYRNQIAWCSYEERFLEQLKNSQTQRSLRELADMARRGNVTLLCIEATAEYCHRRLLAEECQRLVPGIVVEHC
jgi:uncharacterized protein YeaO (DUF488 family)